MESKDCVSPVQQDFIYHAEYLDGKCLFEFDPQTKQENSFYLIQKDKLLRFGLIGHEMHFYFEVDGIFKIVGRMIEIVYRVGDKEYPLTGHTGKYSDIVYYKDAEGSILWDSTTQSIQQSKSNILCYNFGYKTTLNIDGVNFNFQALCKIPYGLPVHFSLWVVSDVSMNGQIVIKQNGREISVFDCPLNAGVGGELNWEVNN